MDDWQGRFCSWQYEDLARGLILSTRDLNRYLNLMGSTFAEITIAHVDPLTDDEAFGISDEQRKIIDDTYSYNYFDHHFPDEFYKSFVMSLYSKIEKELLELCERELELRLLTSPSDTELLGTGIFRAYKFLDQAAGYAIDNNVWQELQIIGRVRNRLVHDDSPYIAPVQKPKSGNAVKINIEIDSLVKDYYLQMDLMFYKHISKLNILKLTGAAPEPNERVWFDIIPSHDYCQYLINFRKKLFMHVYNGLLVIAKSV